MKNIIKIIITLTLILSIGSNVQADAAVGDQIVTLGDGLTEEQRIALLAEMDVEEDEVLMVSVSNEEEHEYLGDYISASQIGTRALSSSLITLTEPGSGINVETNNINLISEGMYANALVTAGIKDADIYVTAPMEVSGTAGLTGLIKAYEISTDEVIPEEQKQIANEEMVKTAELGSEYGVEEATELMTRIKEAIAEEDIETEEDLRALIERLAGELGIELSEEELNGLVSLFDRMKDLNIDWDQVRNQIDKFRDNISGFIDSDEGKSIISSFLDFINNIIDTIRGWITS